MLFVAKCVRAQPGSGHSDSAEWLSKGHGHTGKIHWCGEVVPTPCPEVAETQDYLYKAFPVPGVEGSKWQPHCSCDCISVACPHRNWSTIRKTCLQGAAVTVDALDISGLCQSGRMGPCRMLSAPPWRGWVGRCWGTGQVLTGVPAQPAEMPARPSCCWCGQSAQLMEVELAVHWQSGPTYEWAEAE